MLFPRFLLASAATMLIIDDIIVHSIRCLTIFFSLKIELTDSISFKRFVVLVKGRFKGSIFTYSFIVRLLLDCFLAGVEFFSTEKNDYKKKRKFVKPNATN